MRKSDEKVSRTGNSTKHKKRTRAAGNPSKLTVTKLTERNARADVCVQSTG